jgi:phosphoenolpyruvate synthase/pyruvate phosphate dikinase
LKDKIEKCWESAASQSVLSYLHDPANPNDDVPLNGGDRSKNGPRQSRRGRVQPKSHVPVEETKWSSKASCGLGEKLVSGHVTPYRVFVRDNRVAKGDQHEIGNGPSADHGILARL